MTGVSWIRRLTHVWSLTALLIPVALAAQDENTSNPPTLDLSGYLRSLAGFQELGYDVPLGDRRSGFNGEVVRLKWLIEVGDALRISVHNRLQLRLSTSTPGRGQVLGFGVSSVPERTIDLEQVLVDDEHVRVWHDVDRLSMTVYLPVADITLGRQAITWGTSNLFPIADLWSQFSPFELDTEEKPGLDALRLLSYPSDGLELDVVLADRGTTRDVSIGARLTASLSSADVYGAIGKFWREMIAMGGVSLIFDRWKLRGEMAFPWEMDTETFQSPRATIGVDWIFSDLQISGEYHFNGLGASDASAYARQLMIPQLARGETYFVGRHYVGVAVAHQVTDRLSLVFSNLTNVADPSATLTPNLTYDAGQRIRISVGGLTSVGRKPMFSLVGLPSLRSEFGTYGHFGYGMASLYF